MKYQLSIKNKKLQGVVTLPGSKSVSNRVLIIQALCKDDFKIHNLSPADDTRTLTECLQSESNEFDVGLGGTTMRFLTALLASKSGNWLITGSEEIKKRPIGKLVEPLRAIGAHIQYEGEENYLPLRIQGTTLTGNIITVDTGESSQFISALLLIAPTYPMA